MEQFAIVEGDLSVSNGVQEEMIRVAEEFYQSLGFPYQVMSCQLCVPVLLSRRKTCLWSQGSGTLVWMALPCEDSRGCCQCCCPCQ